jgi:hypothetical protein
MSAVLPYLEMPEAEATEANQGKTGSPSLGAFGKKSAVKDPPTPESAVAELTRTFWTRQELTKLLAERQFKIETIKGKFVFRLNRDIDKDALPWSGSVGKAGHGHTMPYSFFVENSKMGCAGWDLPAGCQHIAGSCPSAVAAQWLVPEDERERFAKKMIPPPGWDREFKVNIRKAICSACYASGYPYSTPFTQAGEMVRFWWAKKCMMTPEGQDEFVTIMTEAVLQAVPDKVDRHGYKYVRVHSSGDFFAPAYYKAWLRIADEVGDKDPSIMFWCPSRVWSLSGYDWSALADLKHDNLVVRASAYHMNDPAPEKLDPSNSRGTTAIYHKDNLGPALALEGKVHPESKKSYEENRSVGHKHWHDERYEWPCQTYAIGSDGLDLSTSCKNAWAPDGKLGCRACWLNKEYRVCYTAH